MKNFLKNKEGENKISSIIVCFIFLFIFLLPSYGLGAEVFGTCNCGGNFTLASCSGCATACGGKTVEIWNYDTAGTRQSGTYPLSNLSCTEDGGGIATCRCGATFDRTSSSDCSGAIASLDVSCRWEGSFTDVGGSCTRDFGCRGTSCSAASGCYCYQGEEDANAAGFPDIGSYWSAEGISSASCYLKLGNGEDCVRNEQCGSGYCGRPEGGDDFSPNVCGIHPGSEGGETSPPAEEEFPTYNIKSPIGEVTGPQLIGRIIKTVLGIVGALALGMFVFGGFTWLTSGGSADKIKKGKDILMWAVIGLIVIFTSYTLVDFILTAFGL